MVLEGQTAAGGFSTATPQTVANVNVAIQNAEDRVSKEIDIPAWRKTVTNLNLTMGSPYFTLPSDFLSMYNFCLAYTDTNISETVIPPLLERDLGFIREAFPSSSALEYATPRYYALQGAPSTNSYQTTAIVGATPDQPYAVTLDYQASVQSIVTSTTSWLGTYAPTALFNLSLVNLYAYLKGETDIWQNIAATAENDLNGLRVLGQGRQLKDTFFKPNQKADV